MNRALDNDFLTDNDDKGPHYNPVRLLVDVTIERGTFGAMDNAEPSAFKVLDDAVSLLNETVDTAHSVTLLPMPTMDTDDPNESRAMFGEAICDFMEALTGVDRESAFTDAVAYLLHAEMLRLAREEPEARTFGEARDLLDAALDSFAGDGEDGPYAFE